jgi:hypothetical protein
VLADTPLVLPKLKPVSVFTPNLEFHCHYVVGKTPMHTALPNKSKVIFFLHLRTKSRFSLLEWSFSECFVGLQKRKN